MRWLLSVVALTAAIASCSGWPESEVTETDLAGRTFVTTGGRPLEVGFGDGGGIVLDAGCNTITGPYHVVDGQVRLTDPSGTFTTTGWCSGRRGARERWIRRLFDQGLLAHLDGDELTLTVDDVELRLREEPA